MRMELSSSLVRSAREDFGKTLIFLDRSKLSALVLALESLRMLLAEQWSTVEQVMSPSLTLGLILVKEENWCPHVTP